MIFVTNIPKKLAFILLIWICVSCHKRNNDIQRESSNPSEVKSECYQYVLAGDTINLSMQRKLHKVTGRLDFKFYEKDNSIGTIEGSMKGDTLLARYLFRSEGMSSLREVAFLKKDDYILMGYGETQMNGGVEVFVNPHVIKFSEAIRLEKVVCNERSL